MASDRQRQSSKHPRRKSSSLAASFQPDSVPTFANPSAMHAVSTKASGVSTKASGDLKADSSHTFDGKYPIHSIDNIATIATLLESVSGDPPTEAHSKHTRDPIQVSGQEIETNAGLETQWQKAIDAKIYELVEQTRAFERERIEIEQLREHLRQAIDVAEARLAATASNESLQRLSELENQLASANTDNAKLSTLLHHARSEYQSLVEFIETESQTDRTMRQKAIESAGMQDELVLEISQLKEQILFLHNELSESQSEPSAVDSDTAELRVQIEKLRSQLLEARNDAVESRLQSSDLSLSLAKYKDPFENQKSEALTWEQRKEALMRQLDAETQAEVPFDPNKALEIETIIQQTDAEIERRDLEIQDLRSLLQQQAIAQNGMAIGVAAVAEMIESDAMIIAERFRLQEMQQEWEKKQRQAEIEMSMERAKLARERLDLQEKSRSFEAEHPAQTAEEKTATKERGRGRWLARLGLRDE